MENKQLKDNIVGERIQSLRKERGMSLDSLGKELGVSKAYISYIERGERQPGRNILVRLADFFNTDIDWMMGRSDIRSSLEEFAIPRLQPIPVYSCISCGTGLWVNEQPEAYTGAPDWMLRPSKDYFANPAEGNSMYPTIENGDCIIFEQTENVRYGQIGAFSLNGSYYCKRLEKKPDGSFWLMSDNEDYDPIPITGDDEFRILGAYRLRITRKGS